ncbi:MAG: hypothetical protein CGU29_10670 [Candidatus Dactylopiibacterium carminicum]|uniref:Uncharacterized protein n=1 Tax=Candidatus Dactylopiibacterium carminicum TaxID=857335 RepID=A0A272ERI0_9RHOO|nr:hypothetical protein [Candidatus Dactylopiibacterium carminicum]KAF7598781.1 hypothetical protein BGI27_11305 [Candidatus Dactylopiibacterium carminicum]PAS92692.1 MAG: hypothetical protein CGU29_10670 [Candidatus Dactylopiibacterium carminicum]PAS98802.1 MAG: hypothetical protein BSR46_11320 [Candidatus Dactylopiibacterium carminicum]
MSDRHTRGYVLLALLTLFLATIAAASASRLILLATDPHAEALRSRIVLQEAREALMAYAALEDNSPGSLPCPDQNNDGWAESGIGTNPCNAPHIGRLPWKTLGLGRLQDATGECLWYALSPDFRNTLQTSTRGQTQARLNPETPGAIIHADTSVVAVLLAPGRPLSHQQRSAPVGFSCNDGVSTDFLEALSADGLSLQDSEGNDIVLTLDSNTLMRLVARRVLHSLALGEPYADRGLRWLIRDQGVPATSLVTGANNLNRAGSVHHTRREFDDALQSVATGIGRTHFEFSRYDNTGCPDYIARYTRLDGLPGATQPDGHPGVPPAEWLCRNDWYAHLQAWGTDAGGLLLHLWPTASRHDGTVLATKEISP